MKRFTYTLGLLAVCGLMVGTLPAQERSSQRRSQDDTGDFYEGAEEAWEETEEALEDAGDEISSWWESWWNDQGQDQDRARSTQVGAREYVRRYDQNEDGYLSRREIPAAARNEFGQLDRDNDDLLSQSELRRYGDQLYDRRQNANRRDAQARNQRSSGEQSWSQWWESWWADDQNAQNRTQGAQSGARQFVRQHDRDDDGYISRQEMPRSMRDEFARIDRNEDDYLSATEIQQHGAVSYTSERRGSEQASRRSPRSRSSQSNRLSDERTTPVDITYVWVIDASAGHVDRRDLQHAYDVLMRLDSNGDGNISSGELQQQREEIITEWSKDCFNKLDENGDQRLTRNEAQDSILDAHFEMLDQNSDQSLTAQEVRRSLQQQLQVRSGTNRQSTDRASEQREYDQREYDQREYDQRENRDREYEGRNYDRANRAYDERQ